jgi:hypothetical protein
MKCDKCGKMVNKLGHDCYWHDLGILCSKCYSDSGIKTGVIT